VTKLGSKAHPAVVRVQTEQKAGEILKFCDERGWTVVVGLTPDEPEDLSDLERLQNPPAPARAEAKVGRNEPCPCGSGLKHKKCCGS